MANNALIAFQPQNVQLIMQSGPKALEENQLSHDRCLEIGRELIARATAEGVNEALDQELKTYIERSKKTLTKMNTKRSPVTKIFDEVRSVFTSMENEVDPAKKGTIPYQAQQLRNQYAAKLHEQAEAQRRAEEARQARTNAIARYTSDVTEDFKAQLNRQINAAINTLNELDSKTTLENYETMYNAVKVYSTEIPQGWWEHLRSTARIPVELTMEEATAIQASVIKNSLLPFAEQYRFEVEGMRDDILDRLPSKRVELQRIAKADAEEAARIKAQMQERERAEAQRKEQERIERERQEKAAAELASQKQEMDSLFGLPVATPVAYQPKTQVKQRVVIESADDVMAVVAFWWAQEGSKLPVDELKKIFKKQITFAEKMANDRNNPITITNVRYEDEVKAK